MSQRYWASLSPEFAAQTTTASARSRFRQRRIPRSSRGSPPETPAGTRESPQGQARKILLTAGIPAYTHSARKRQDRPVTPEVAGSSPVAPVSLAQSACKLGRSVAYRDANDRRLPGQPAHIPHETSPAIPARSRTYPVIPSARGAGQPTGGLHARECRSSMFAGTFASARCWDHPARIPRCPHRARTWPLPPRRRSLREPAPGVGREGLGPSMRSATCPARKVSSARHVHVAARAPLARGLVKRRSARPPRRDRRPCRAHRDYPRRAERDPA